MLLGAQYSAAAQPNVPNPPWPASCPLRLGLLVDQSSSMAPRFDDVRDAARNVVDSLRDRQSEVSIIGFGTSANVVSRAVDVSDDDARHELKDQVETLDALDGDSSATNWEAALAKARALELDVVILVTDGIPNVHGNPVRENDKGAVTAAAAVADQLKNDGTRIAAVGIDLDRDGEDNLRVITGARRDNDYYVTDTDGLLRQLYGIVASSCGVPLAALPQPESPDFPWTPTLLGAVGGLVLLIFVAFLLRRRRDDAAGRQSLSRGGHSMVVDLRINHSHLIRQLRDSQTESLNRDSSKDQP